MRPDTPRRRSAGWPIRRLLLVLPGSRSGEIRRMATMFGDALRLVADRVGALEVVVPAVPRLAGAVAEAVASWPVPVRIVTDAGGKARGLPDRRGRR